MLDTFTGVYLPYCLQRQADGRYAVLNREYKPVGFNTMKVVNYNDYPVSVRLTGLGSAMARELSCKGSDDVECIQMYNDGCNPCAGSEEMRAYLERLALLAKLKVS